MAPSAKKKHVKAKGEIQHETRVRVDYVLQCIRDQPWLDGNRRKLEALLLDRYPDLAWRSAQRAVRLAYRELDEARSENAADVAGYLDRVHRRTIELGLRTGDGRIVTPAAVALGKLYGVGEPDKLQLSGSVQGGVSTGDRMLLEALKLTNAQRLAEIDKLSAELGRPPPTPPGKQAKAPVQPPTEDDLTVPDDPDHVDIDDQGDSDEQEPDDDTDE